MKLLVLTAICCACSTFAMAKPLPPLILPKSFQGDWIDIANSKQRARACRDIRADSYFDVGTHYLLTFTPNSVEHRYAEVYLEDVALRFSHKEAQRLQGRADQTYQENGADQDFPVKRGLAFEWRLQADGSLRAPHLRNKAFYRCPVA
ncbi:hypothetical protein LVJ82_03040 [Vitreoscilla massiliensis]|uniref:Lipoprotein n=1 Tax=Vitreoscilla massiliensis TaxID=1689272 RepID=A0ABY4E2H0_9NEIS|nr:hypothetical protein [Vitreoscilla massiliensis]UOO89978.1 hypothetical protein LVJ82_03040 [Vitreoscilla massiliensis]